MTQGNAIVKQDEDLTPVPYVPEDRALTAQEIKAQADKVLEVMRAVMRKDVHFGIVPGTNKPTLLKPGSEKLLSTFRIACNPIPTDLSTSDEVRYRVEARGTSMSSGAYLGSGIGECSSSEEKYAWRRTVCEEEWNSTPEDRRRVKWAKKEGKPYAIKQVRTNPADVANTILKMGKKRAQIDLTLTVTAASDVFQQDLEDLPEEVRESVVADDKPKTSTVTLPTRRSESSPANGGSGDVISEPQRKRLYAIYKNAGVTDEQMKDYLLREYGIESFKDIKRLDYEAICNWAQGSEPGVAG